MSYNKTLDFTVKAKDQVLPQRDDATRSEPRARMKAWALGTAIALIALTVGSVFPSASLTVRTAQFAPNTGTINSVVAFGTDIEGNVYIVDIGGEVFVLEPNP